MSMIESAGPGLLVILFGAALPGLFFFNQRLLTRRRRRLTGRAWGLIAGFEHRRFFGSSGLYNYYPVVSWRSPDGAQRTFEHDDSDQSFTLGMTVPVMFDPANPADAPLRMSASDSTTRIAAVLFSIVGVGVVVAGIAIVVNRLA